MKKPDIVLVLCVLIVLFIGAALFGTTYEPPLLDAFAGTFVSGEAMEQVGLSIDAEGGEFFYEDQSEGLYIRGTVTAREDGAYEIKCLNPENTAVIPNQTVVYADLQIAVIVSNISDEPTVFRKVDDVPILVKTVEEFS